VATQQPGTEVIDRLTNGAFPAFAMLAGIQLDLFTHVSHAPMTGEEIAKSLAVSEVKLRPLLYALVAAQLLEVEGDRFSNTAEADYYLSQGKPGYRASRIVRRWEAVLKTAETIRTGVPQGKLDFVDSSPDYLERFYRGGLADTLTGGRDLARRYDFSGYRRLLDVAGGSGGLAIAIAELCPDLRATIVDLPSVTPITDVIVKESEVANRVTVLAGDVVAGPLSGSYDVAVIRSFIQVLSMEQARQAIKNVGKVVEPNGKIYIMGAMLDNTRLTPTETAVLNLNFLNTYDEGQAYTEEEHQEWLIEAGLTDLTRVALPGGRRIMTGRKVA
jgi:SAM-dependent methyltransferase